MLFPIVSWSRRCSKTQAEPFTPRPECRSASAYMDGSSCPQLQSRPKRTQHHLTDQKHEFRGTSWWHYSHVTRQALGAPGFCSYLASLWFAGTFTFRLHSDIIEFPYHNQNNTDRQHNSTSRKLTDPYSHTTSPSTPGKKT